MVFNIATQNANMLDLKQLSKITPKSMFISANTSLESIFGKSRQNHLQKKMYLEFF
jgi:ABC-type Fe3+-citrate transport system substrate-binding protein